jgi:hypothetical protein
MAQLVSVAPDSTILILELNALLSLAEIGRIRDQAEAALPGVKIIVLPLGCEAKALTVGGVFHHERYEDYEYTAIARTEEDLRSRLAWLHDNMPAVANIVQEKK